MSTPESQPQSLTSPSETSIQDQVKVETLKHNREKSKASNFLGLMGSILSFREGREQFQNRQAENQAVRKKLWGYEPQAGADDMEKYVMGDNTESVNHYHPPKPPSLFGKALTALAVASPLIAGAVMAPAIIDAWQGKPETQTVVEPGTDRDWRILEPIVE